MTTYPMTIYGAEKLRKTLQKLKTERRPQITVAIAEARSHGDLKENAEYHAAKEEQILVERTIAELESRLARSKIIDPKSLVNTKQVVFGATVHLFSMELQDTLVYQIVGEDESDINAKKLSINSPIARALIGKEVDMQVNVQAPSGEQAFKIVKIEYI